MNMIEYIAMHHNSMTYRYDIGYQPILDLFIWNGQFWIFNNDIYYILELYTFIHSNLYYIRTFFDYFRII